MNFTIKLIKIRSIDKIEGYWLNEEDFEFEEFSGELGEDEITLGT